jgi:ectoine hydroxylase-related dioxygenase (phytanoyl-CoA dioxygenase family)
VVTAASSRGAGGEAYAARGLNRSIPVLAEALRHAQVESLAERFLGVPAVLVDATFFDKHAAANWAVPSHQDRVVAAAHADVPGARVRRGEAYSEPVAESLGSLIALRLHFDTTDERTGALQLISGSHLWGIVPDGKLRELTPGQFTMVDANPGDVVVMRPLTVHRSPSGSAPAHRRVLHVVYGDANLARELGWESVLHS